jgi:hypothetical protein
MRQFAPEIPVKVKCPVCREPLGFVGEDDTGVFFRAVLPAGAPRRDLNGKVFRLPTGSETIPVRCRRHGDGTKAQDGTICRWLMRVRTQWRRCPQTCSGQVLNGLG